MKAVATAILTVLRWVAIGASVVVSCPALAAMDLPRDNGLPVIVQAGASFLTLDGFDENAGTFRATVDIRLRWTDQRLARTGPAAGSLPETLRDAEAQARMSDIWVPPVVVSNQIGQAALSDDGLRIYPRGGSSFCGA
ncbi:hypothetical protein LP421_21245 [Rhizobium sp. RCAM05350]|nr:hypothetical protein LP421_21245 [Rhizobium sp. RCAM05350]